jgi:hypothetical protein
MHCILAASSTVFCQPAKYLEPFHGRAGFPALLSMVQSVSEDTTHMSRKLEWITDAPQMEMTKEWKLILPRRQLWL